MRIARLTLMECMLMFPILGLFCSIPIQCRRAMELDDCRMAAGHHAEIARELTMMASEPAAWMDEFRPRLRRMASWQQEQNLRLTRSSFVDQGEEDRIADLTMTAQERMHFWDRFQTAALVHGYPRPRVGPAVHRSISIMDALGKAFPTYCLIGLLAWLLLRLRRRTLES